MAEIFRDTFLGTPGLLSEHVSDSGHYWIVTSYQDAQVGSGLRGIANAADRIHYEASSQFSSSASDAVTIVADFDISFPVYVDFGHLSFGIRSDAGIFEAGINFFAEGPLVYIGGSVVYAPINNIIQGNNTYVIVLHLSTSIVDLYMNGVMFFSGNKAQSMASPFGAYVSHSNDYSDAVSVVINRLSIYDEAEPPPGPEIQRFWMNLKKTAETI